MFIISLFGAMQFECTGARAGENRETHGLTPPNVAEVFVNFAAPVRHYWYSGSGVLGLAPADQTQASHSRRLR